MTMGQEVLEVADKYGGEIVECSQKRMLKIRCFPSEQALDHIDFSSTPIQCHTDMYYDTPNSAFGKDGKYIRCRVVKDESPTMEELDSTTVNSRSHIVSYLRKLMCLPANVDEKPFLEFTYQRKQGRFKEPSLQSDKIKISFDRIEHPIVFEIISIDIDITNVGDAFLSPILSHLMNEKYLPVSTKFMFMLQLSKRHDLYKKVFQQWNCVEHAITQQVDSILDCEQEQVDHLKAYIWLIEAPTLFSGALESFKGEINEAFSLLNELRNFAIDSNSSTYLCSANQAELF